MNTKGLRTEYAWKVQKLERKPGEEVGKQEREGYVCVLVVKRQILCDFCKDGIFYCEEDDIPMEAS